MQVDPVVFTTERGRLVSIPVLSWRLSRQGILKTWPDPAEVISSILSSASQGKAEGEGLRLVELGAGTGICTRLLLAAATEAPYKLASLNAIEPSSGMRTALSQSLATLNMGPDASVTVQDGTFEHFDAGANNDAVIVAQAFHWCQDFDAAVTQAANSLRPGGVLALLWNLEDRDAGM